MTRTLDFPIQISDWATHVAKDGNGSWFEYEYRPKPSSCRWQVSQGKYEHLFIDSDTSNWEDSLFEVMK